MIPLTLTLRNFMSYGEGHPPLNLEGIHVACLSGPNGHGKSSLLDAMVWALWGEVRGGSRAGDDLIRHGAAEMSVEFELEVGGERYRTLRRRAKRGRTGATELHFESWDGDSWRSLDGGSATETQQVISQTLHMTHNTFVHASFIAQGQADAFMNLDPRNRKQVLGDILDLGQYDLLAKAANEEKRSADSRSSIIEGQIKKIEEESARRPEYAKRLAEAEQAEGQARELVQRLTGERLELVGEMRKLELVERQVGEKAAERKRITDRIRSLEAQARELHQRVTAAEALAEQSVAIERDYAEYLRLDDEERLLGQAFEPWRQATDDVRAVESAIEREHDRLATQIERARQEAARLDRRQEARPTLFARLQELQTNAASLEAVAADQVLLREQGDATSRTLAELKQAGEHLKDELAAGQQRRTLLGENDTCPVCGQKLGLEGLLSAQERLDQECATLGTRLERTRGDYGRASAGLKALQERIKGAEAQLNGRPALERAIGDLQAQITQMSEDAAALETARTEVSALTLVLAQNDFALEHRARHTGLVALLAAIPYDPNRHNRVREEREALRQAPVRRQLLEGARATLDSQGMLHDGLRVQVHEAQVQDAALVLEIDALTVEATRLPVLRETVKTTSNHLQQAATLGEAASRDLGEARQHISWLNAQAQDQERLTAERKEALADVGAYAQLAEAFGKNGIQEMIVEQAIPEIEDVANDLLGRLTDGRMRVAITTQREGRTGVTSTLDVNVSDELGTRPYELFSGGEKFRINFAIRIALSRLLARRAGVPLQMLAIDEGFGSQDRQGCDRLIEAIRSIQDDFARVLVITHLEDMKDAFPVLIEVTKTASGSTFTIG